MDGVVAGWSNQQEETGELFFNSSPVSLRTIEDYRFDELLNPLATRREDWDNIRRTRSQCQMVQIVTADKSSCAGCGVRVGVDRSPQNACNARNASAFIFSP